MHTQRAPWQLEPRGIPEDHGHIASNKSRALSVVLEPKNGRLALKKPVKESGEIPSENDFRRFMEFSAGLDHPNILRYDGVFFLESLQMPLMRCSVRQFREGKTVVRDGRSVQVFKGWARVQPRCVMQVAVGVAKGLFYLHSQKGVSHDGLSSSNVLLNYQNPACIEEVKLVDYQLGLLGTSSQSHADSNCMYKAPEGTNLKRADLYSLGVLMVYMYTGEPSRGQRRQAEWERKVRDFRTDDMPDVADMWENVVSKCLDMSISLTAGEVVSALEEMLH